MCRILSDLLDVQDIRIIKCEYYTDVGETSKKPVITQGLQGVLKGRNVLVVDDVADSGKSLVAITDYLKRRKPNRLKVVTLYTKPKTSRVPDYFAKSTGAWIIFPWELFEATKLLTRRDIKFNIDALGIPRRYKKMILAMSGMQPRNHV